MSTYTKMFNIYKNISFVLYIRKYKSLNLLDIIVLKLQKVKILALSTILS